MTLTYQTAIVSFCPDLTDPGARSFPVAVLMLGDLGPYRCASAVALLPARLQRELGPLAREFLEDVPALLRRQVNESRKRLQGTAATQDLLNEIRHALRNSLHVSAISEPEEVEAENMETLHGHLQRVPFEVLKSAIEESGLLHAYVEPTPLVPNDPLGVGVGTWTPPTAQQWNVETSADPACAGA